MANNNIARVYSTVRYLYIFFGFSLIFINDFNYGPADVFYFKVKHASDKKSEREREGEKTQSLTIVSPSYLTWEFMRERARKEGERERRQLGWILSLAFLVRKYLESPMEGGEVVVEDESKGREFAILSFFMPRHLLFRSTSWWWRWFLWWYLKMEKEKERVANK